MSNSFTGYGATISFALSLLRLEHKAQKKPQETILQLLSYQVGTYQKQGVKLIPVVPVIVYNGKTKDYHGPIKFHDLFEGFDGQIKKMFGPHILNFECFLLNIHDLDLRDTKRYDLDPVLFVMQNIFGIDENVIKTLFHRGNNLDTDDRNYQITKAIEYVKSVDPNISWKKIDEIEKDTVTDKRRHIVQLMQSTLERARAEGRAEGRTEGRTEGRAEGRTEGRAEEKIEIASKLLKKGTKIEDVALVTGLSMEEVRGLEKSRD